MRGHIRKRGARSWAVVLDLGRDHRGHRKQKWHTIQGTKSDAERELARLLHEINTGGYVAPTKMSVEDYLERWLSDGARSRVSPKTFERYTDIVRGHLVPRLGHIPLAKLTPLDIQGHYTWALTEGRRDGRGGLSKQSVVPHHRILNRALRQAVRWQLIARNPVDAVESPRPDTCPIRALNESETFLLLKAAENSRLYPVILLAVTTGMRRGELLALKWNAVDLERKSLSVFESLEQTRDTLRFKRPKSAKGQRKIDLLRLAEEELRHHRARQREHKLLLGPAYADHDLVFPEPDGTLWAPDKLTRAFAALVRRHGLEGLRFHDLRHSHATQLLRQGVHPKVVSERLGHATVSITLDLYSHVLPGMQKEAAERLDAALRIARAKDMTSD